MRSGRAVRGVVLGVAAALAMSANAAADFNSYPGPKATVQDYLGQKLLNFYGTDRDDTIVARPDGGKLRVTVNGAAVLLDGPAAAIGCKNGDGTATVCPFAFDTLTVAGFAGSDRLDLREVPKPEIAYVDGSVPGNTTILGGPMADKLYGGVGNDTINGGPGDDFIGGGQGGDVLTGGSGADFLNGEDGNDVMHATDGEKDYVNCDSSGTDNDSGDADARDTLNKCEQVTQPAPPPEAPESTPEPTPTEAPPHPHSPHHTPPPTATPTPEPSSGSAFNEDDQDGDGDDALSGDCDDHDPTVSHYGMDVPGDGIDQDCLGGDAKFKTFNNPPQLGFTVKGKRTKVFRFKLRSLPAGASYAASCKGKHCPTAAIGTVAATTTIDLKHRYHGRKLPVGTKITVTLSAPETITYTDVFTVQKDFDPRHKTHCTDPAGTPQDCYPSAGD